MTQRKSFYIDRLITNRILGLPIFIAMLWIMFEATFTLGQYPMNWIGMGVEYIQTLVGNAMSEGMLKDMITQGILEGVGSVIVFLPQILILYFFIAFMEETGYMARAAFIMDKAMHFIGLEGRSFIPLVMAFGCNVPAIMATRTIENRRSRIVTILILPFISCSARVPIYVMIVGAMFAPHYRSTIMLVLYLMGILTAVVLSKFLTRYVFHGTASPYVRELPPYRMPSLKSMATHTWDKGRSYLRKMGGIILVASILVWTLGYFPHKPELSPAQQQEQSYIGQMGKALEPVFAPQGFSWRLDVSLISGLGAKEMVASTLGILYADSHSDECGIISSTSQEQIPNHSSQCATPFSRDVTPLTAFCFLVFISLYFPCMATIAAIKAETASWRYALFAAGYTTLTAWIVSALIYQIACLI